MTSASAPGKIILVGEHAVVYGRPALAVPVTQVHAEAQVTRSSRPGVWIEAPDIGLRAELASLPVDHPLAALIRELFQRAGLKQFPALEITIRSTIPVGSGLGSGAAVSVALARALSAELGGRPSDAQVSELAFEIEKLHHGTPSGIDNAVIAHARPVYFVRGQPLQSFTVGRPMTLVLGDTGLSAPTKESVGDVRRLWEHDPQKWEAVFGSIGVIAERSRRAIEAGELERLGELLDRNHALLQELTVSSPELDRLSAAARSAGALGAKLSGGGRGGNMLALTRSELAGQVCAALKDAGARSVITTVVE